MQIPIKNKFLTYSIFILSLTTLLIFLIRLYENFSFIVDDSFITFRYVDHLAQGVGLFWNKSDLKPTEGYTSFLWILFLVPSKILDLDLVIYSKLLSISLILIIALIYYLLIQNHTAYNKEKEPALFLILITFFCNADLITHLVSGMETILISLILTSFSVFIIKFLEQPNRNIALVVSSLAFLIGLTRPEFNLFTISTFFISYFILKEKQYLIKWVIIPFLLFGSIYFISRYFYFEVPLPLPFYIKQFKQSELFPGIRPTLRFIIIYFPLLILIIYLLFKAVEIKKIIPLITAFLIMLFYYLTIQHIMGYNNRYLFPLFPVLIVIVIYLINNTSIRFGKIILMLFMLSLIFFISQSYYYNISKKSNDLYIKGLNQAHIKLGKILNKIDSNERFILAVGDAGAIPYYSGWYTIDTYGLNNRTIAYRRWHGNYEVLDIFRKFPDLIILLSKSIEKFDPLIDHERFIQVELNNYGYNKIVTLKFNEEYYLWIYAKNDSLYNFILNSVPDNL